MEASAEKENGSGGKEDGSGGKQKNTGKRRLSVHSDMLPMGVGSIMLRTKGRQFF